MIELIYLDMDGVLCDFEKRYHEMFGMIPKDVPKKGWTEYWDKFVGGKNFQTLDWHPEGKELYFGVRDYAKNKGIQIQILTSAGGEEMIEEIGWQKRRWLLNNDVKHRYLNVVPGKRYKKDFASPKAVIIDDTESIIKNFREAGGHAIHHKGDAKKTLEALIGGSYANV